MQKNAEIKDILLKEASERIYITKELDIKNALLNDAIMHIASAETHIASVDKSAMAAQMGSSYYRLASNVEVTEFPEEEHSKIKQIKKEIMDNFAPLLIQRIKSQGKWVKVDLSELLGGDTPFYIRLQFKKHILPMENKEQIVNELEGLAPEFSQLVETLEEMDLAPVPYYNIQCEKSYKDPAVQLTQKMLSELAAPVSTGWTGNFVTQQPNLKGYWERMNQEMSDPDPKKFPPLYRTIGASTYSTALRWPAEKIDQIPDMNTLLQGVYFAETNENNSLYSASPQDQKEKKAQWEAFVFSQILPSGEKQSPQDEDKAKILARQKAQVVAERVWKVFGEVPPEKRDIKASVGRGKLEAPYNQFHQNDIRMLLKFLKVPQIRFTSTPRARPNGLDMGHIYPPVNFNAESNTYGLDYIRGNCGLKQLKLNLPKFMSLATNARKQINDIYERLAAQKDHPVMQSHTGADNFLFMLQNLPNMQMTTFSPDYDDKIKKQYGSAAPSILNFVRGMLGSLKATKKDADVLNQGPNLFAELVNPTGNGVCFGYQIAKILDVLQYTILKNLPDPVYKVRGRNYATGGISGELMLAVEYAYGVVPNTDIAGGNQESIRALEQAPRPMSGVSPDMVRKTHHYQRFEGTEQFPQMEKKPVYVEQGDAKLAPQIAYIVTHKTGGTHSRPQKGKNFETLEAAMAYMQGLYPQAEGAMETLQQKLYLISLRMDLATKEIRSIVEEAIKLKQAEINEVLGTGIMSETGQDIDESLADLGKEVSSIKEEVQEYDPNYVVEEGHPHHQSVAGLVKEVGQGIPQAAKIVVQLLATENEEIAEYLKENGYKGQFLVDIYNAGGLWNKPFKNVNEFADSVKTWTTFIPWQKEQLTKINLDKFIDSLGQNNPIAEKVVSELIKLKRFDLLDFLEEKGIKGGQLAHDYIHPALGNENLKVFIEVLEQGMQSHQKEDEIFGKKPKEEEFTQEEQNWIKLLGQGVPIAEVLVENLIYSEEGNILEFLRQSNVKGSNLVQLYKSFKVNNVQDFVVAITKLPQYYSWIQSPYPQKQVQVTEKTPQTKETLEFDVYNNPIEEPEKNAENRISKLIKLADKFDNSGYTHIANKIDLLLAKIKD